MKHSLSIRGRKTAVRSIPPWQPYKVHVFPRVQSHWYLQRYTQPENVLGVMRHAWCVTVAPLGIDFIRILQLPVCESTPGSMGVYAGFLHDFARGGRYKVLCKVVSGPGD